MGRKTGRGRPSPGAKSALGYAGTTVEKPSRSRADAAYERALAAYREKSYEVARRWTNEALAHDPHHSGAATLLVQLNAARRQTASTDSEVVSTDPTILISRAAPSSSQPPPVDQPTVLIPRPAVRRPAQDPDTQVPLTNARPVSEPTVIAEPRQRPRPRAKQPSTVGAALQSFGERLQARRSRPPSPGSKSTTGSRSGAQGVLLALGTVAVGALLVLAVYLAVRWMWPAGQLLTITKPTGGTIVGPGIECGTTGSRCSTTIGTGEPIELEPRPDKDYVWTGYTGDCAPAGRTVMTSARTCGATFDRLTASAGPATFRLTITKPVGGTVIAAGGILCGVNGSTCSADIPSGAPVSLKAEAAEGFAWQQFTGDCPSTGEMMMTSAKTCSAVFTPSAAPINRGPVSPPVKPPTNRPSGGSSGRPPVPTPPVQTPEPPSTPATQVPLNPPGSLGPSNPTVPTNKPAAPAMSQEDHAKREIGELVKKYCTALGTLKPDVIRGLFHMDNTRALKELFKEYRSLKCTVTSEPEYDRLDAGSSGGAQLRVGMKQVPQMSSGGAPKTLDLIVTLVVSRKDFQSPWLIDRVTNEEKPK